MNSFPNTKLRIDRDQPTLHINKLQSVRKRLWGFSIHFIHATGKLVTQLSQMLSIVFVFLNCTTALGQDLQAEKVLEWNFQRSDDKNLDKEPDGWRRRRDRQHPAYIESKIVPRDENRAREANREQLFAARVMHALESGRWDPNYIPESIPEEVADFMDRFVFNNCLEIVMDGGAAEIVSPIFPVDPRFSYVLKVEASCAGLNGHEAWAELQLLDSREKMVETLSTERISGTTEWEHLSTTITSAASQELRLGRVHLRVDPRNQLLINGSARFDTISIHRLPRLSLTMDLPEHIAQPNQKFSVRCSAMGIRHHSSTVRFELRDHLHRLLKQESVGLIRAGENLDAPRGETFVASQTPSPLKPPHYVSAPAPQASTSMDVARPRLVGRDSEEIFDGNAIWELELATPGLYRVSVALGNGSNQLDREILIGVMPKQQAIAAGPFGWSVASIDHNTTPESIPYYVERFGAGWVKFPVWFDMSDTLMADRLVQMTERLQTLGIQCVGRIDQPPDSQRELFGEGSESLPALVIFRDGQAWEPVLEPVLTRMGLKIDWFQIGNDDDRSFQNHINLSELVADIRSRMQNYSQELKLALCWSWLDHPQSDAGAPWNALQFSTEPQLTTSELSSYATEKIGEGSDLWVTLDPLDEKNYTLIDRVRDLTERMVVIKQTGISAAFVRDPFAPSTGLFRDGFSIGELLIPWTTLVSAIGEKEYVGSVELPAGSYNHAFVSENTGLMLLWSDVPKTEALYLGREVSATDVWGRTVPVEQVTTANGSIEQRIGVDRWPIIVHGIDINVVRWRQQFQLEVDNLASMIGDRQDLPVTVVNTFDQPMTGKLSVHGETLLGGSVADSPIQLPHMGRQTIALPLGIRPDASAGKHDLRFDIRALSGGVNHNFSVYRQITLGAGDIEFKWDMARKSPQVVELRVELLNNTKDTTSFDCKYFPVGKPYQRFQILEARPGITLREINLNITLDEERQGAWLRCEEIGSGQVLNYRLGQ